MLVQTASCMSLRNVQCPTSKTKDVSLSSIHAKPLVQLAFQTNPLAISDLAMQKFDEMQIFAHQGPENELCYHSTPYNCTQTRTYFPADAFTLPHFQSSRSGILRPRTISFTARGDSHLTRESARATPSLGFSQPDAKLKHHCSSEMR
jgi:hypothetical protein